MVLCDFYDTFIESPEQGQEKSFGKFMINYHLSICGFTNQNISFL